MRISPAYSAVISIVFALPLPCAAQTISEVLVQKSPIQIGGEVVVTVNFLGEKNKCGLRIDFGNGEQRDIRIGNNGDRDFPLLLSHRYPAAGNFTIRVSGASLTRGFNSVSACAGVERTAQVIVEDPKLQLLRDEANQRKVQLEQYEERIRQLELRETARKEKEKETDSKPATGTAANASDIVDTEIPKDRYKAVWCETGSSSISVCVKFDAGVNVIGGEATVSRTPCNGPDAAQQRTTIVYAEPPVSGSTYTFSVPDAPSIACASFRFFGQARK